MRLNELRALIKEELNEAFWDRKKMQEPEDASTNAPVTSDGWKELGPRHFAWSNIASLRPHGLLARLYPMGLDGSVLWNVMHDAWSVDLTDRKTKKNIMHGLMPTEASAKKIVAALIYNEKPVAPFANNHVYSEFWKQLYHN